LETILISQRSLNPRAVIFVEFFGLSGAGKTILSKELERQLAGNGVQVVSRHDQLADECTPLHRHFRRSRFVLFGLTRRPFLFWSVLRMILLAGQGAERDLFKVIWNFWCVMGWYLWHRAGLNGATLAIVDQGLLQAIWSVRFKARSRRGDWVQLLKDIGISDILFVKLNLSPALARDRLLARECINSRLASFGNGGNESRWWQANEMLDEVLIDLQPIIHEGQVVTLRDDGNTSPSVLVQELLAVQEFLQ
jgi:hypothetical protein